MSWPTPAELGRYTQRDIDAADMVAQLVLDLAKGAVQAETGQTIEYVVNDIYTFDGNNDDILILPQLPVVNVDTVTYEGSLLVIDVGYAWSTAGILRRLPAGGTWGTKRAGVVVQYDHGFTTIPNAIRSVVLSVASRLYANPDGVQAETIGNYSVTYSRGEGAATTQTIAFTEDELRMLAPYRDAPILA